MSDSAENDAPADQRRRILVVDDNAANLDVLRRLLEGGPWQISVATSGEAALEVVSRAVPDLILLDVMLPGIDGIETCRRIKASPGFEDVPVVFVTADPKVLAAGFEAGGVDYLTKPVRAEELLCRVHNHLQTRELVQALRQELLARESLARLGELVSEVTHEVNTPLGVCVMAASTLLSAQQDFLERFRANTVKREEVEVFLSRIHEAGELVRTNIDEASRLISDFKDLAADEASRRCRRIQLADHVRKVIENIGPVIRGAGVRVSVNIPEDAELLTLPGSLGQILRNLIINSVVHGFEGRRDGHIEIGAELKVNHWSLSYADNGCGIPEENRERLFDKFFTTRVDRGGTGIGTHVVKTLVERLGGSLELDTGFAQGVRFVFRFPYELPGDTRPPD